MAENKKSFLLYADQIHVVKKLVEQDRLSGTNNAGELFLHLLGYVNDQNPVPVNFIVDMAFEPIKQQLKRDLDKWDEELIKKSDSGLIGNLKRWHPDLYNKVVSNELSLHDATSEVKNRKASHPDRPQSHPIANIAVNGTVNDINTSTSNTNVLEVVGQADYKPIVKDLKSVTHFIRTKKPKFAEPYVDLWNLFAEKYGPAKVKTISNSRKKKLKVRAGEKEFDFPEILKAAAEQKFALESTWFTFDFLIENDNNYIKVLEKKYVSKEISKPAEEGLSDKIKGEE